MADYHQGACAINAKKFYSLISIFWVLALILAACGGGNETAAPPTPTRFPTLTPTLRSTPLPDAPTVVPFGGDEHPITIGFVAQDVTSATLRRIEDALNDDISGDTVIEVKVFPSMGEALAAVCNGTTPTVAWVDAFTYIAAEQRCGAEVRLGLEKSPVDVNRTRFEIIYHTDLIPAPNDLADVRGRRWCRIAADDVVTWVYPALTMQTAGINPLADLEAIVEVEDYRGIVEAIVNDQCDMGAIPPGRLRGIVRQLERENRNDEDREIFLTIVLVGPTSDLVTLENEAPAVPADVFIVPSSVVIPFEVQAELVSAMSKIVATEDDDDPIRTLLNYVTSEVKTSADYADFRAWLLDAKWAMDQE